MHLLSLALTLGFEVAGMVWSYWFGSVYVEPGWVQIVHLTLPRIPLTTQDVGLVFLVVNVSLHLLAVVAFAKKLLKQAVSHRMAGSKLLRSSRALPQVRQGRRRETAFAVHPSCGHRLVQRRLHGW